MNLLEKPKADEVLATSDTESAEPQIPLIAAPDPEGSSGQQQLSVLDRKVDLVWAIVFIAVAIGIFVFLRPQLFDTTLPQYQDMITTLDEKKSNVMLLAAATSAASAGITLLPGDVASPIADKLADLSGYLIIILAVIYSEKFLLAMLGGVGIGVLVPASLILFAVLRLWKSPTAGRQACLQVACRFLLFGIAISFVVPTSVLAMQYIDQSFADSINYTVDISDEAEAEAAEEKSSKEDSSEKKSSKDDEADQDIFHKLKSLVEQGAEEVAAAAEKVTEVSENTVNFFTDKFNQIIDTIAVMIVTSCLIPILVLIAFFWLVNNLLNINIGSPGQVFQASAGASRKARTSFKTVKARGKK